MTITEALICFMFMELFIYGILGILWHVLGPPKHPDELTKLGMKVHNQKLLDELEKLKRSSLDENDIRTSKL